MVRTQIQLTERQSAAIKRIAASRSLSAAEVIRRAVDVVIQSSPTADPGERRRKALEAIGKFRSGKRDVSARHDRYLADAFAK